MSCDRRCAIGVGSRPPSSDAPLHTGQPVSAGRPVCFKWGADGQGASMAEPKLVVEHREQLWSLLVEAAQIEHMIMCQYL